MQTEITPDGGTTNLRRRGYAGNFPNDKAHRFKSIFSVRLFQSDITLRAPSSIRKMQCLPAPGLVTVCEINRYLIAAESLSDEQAKESYGNILGVVFSPVPFQSDFLLNTEQGSEHGSGESSRVSGLTTLQKGFLRSFKWFLPAKEASLPTEVNLQGVSWHHHKHILAFISGPNQVTVRDYEDSEVKDPCILTSESQRGVKVLEWRPNGGKTLAVACKGGICIWCASFPGNTAPIRSGVASHMGRASRGSGVWWTMVDFLQNPYGEQVSTLSWSPNGRYLASASFHSSSFTIWDVAQGVGTPIRRGLGGISMLSWSPTGDYFFTAKFDGTFYLWETNTWTSEPWSSSGGYVTGASWDPDGRMILLAFSESTTLGSIHFSSKPPSLDAHLLPVDFPEIASLTGSGAIEKIAWDASGERLALSYKGGNETYAGLVAVYDVRRSPLISATLIGFIRGPGEKPSPLAFSFHDRFKQGPILSVCWSSGWCCSYPLIFRSHPLS
ncbi:aladin [Aristolochia californica]|uniref:aladin n=1 Tax=Aristolochia californica TaxID=171875 RepID=UPI0035DDC60C